jgi:hypothetical protein
MNACPNGKHRTLGVWLGVLTPRDTVSTRRLHSGISRNACATPRVYFVGTGCFVGAGFDFVGRGRGPGPGSTPWSASR